ncbi:MAG TPA: DEAD/DEAH box helicase [Kofleriaceae bacterium]|nr:DEAD/DEAH box helicase [Kofleriaceae bacterium]
MKQASTGGVAIAPAMTPHGRLLCVDDAEAVPLEAGLAARLRDGFAAGPGEGLLALAGMAAAAMPAAWAYWRELATRYVAAVCLRSGDGGDAAAGPASPSRSPSPSLSIAAPSADELTRVAAAAPAMTGGEYVTADTLAALWSALDAAFAAGVAASNGSLQEFLRALDPAWHLGGRVYFNLAEHRGDDEAPFAFIATYTMTRAGGAARAQHIPLGQALREYAGEANRDKLLSLLVPVQRAADQCPWLRALVDEGAIFHALRWTAAEAFRMLGDVAALEQAGVIVRMPVGWKAGRPARPKVTATVGAKPPAGVGQEALLDFRVDLTLDGEPLAPGEIEQLLAATDGLAMLRGRWIELDREKLEATLRHLREVERRAAADGLAFAEAMRLLAGADVGAPAEARVDPAWTGVVAGPWLDELLRGLRAPDGIRGALPGDELRATLRPYQQAGVRWMHLLSSLGLGACLADDMGLGKTIQVLALLLVRRREAKARRPSLLVAPASLLGNWAAELERFAPSLRALVVHPSAMPAATLAALTPAALDADLVITTYGTLHRVAALAQTSWDLLVVDEAQAIKNPAARQTRAVKQLAARARIALTGTPVENRLGDLWSIFDFVNPGLLGSARQFTAFTKQMIERKSDGSGPYGPLRELVRPYLLRRLKTDRAVIADLPDKTEVQALCSLSKRQAALYQQAVEALADELARGKAEGIERRGLVLAFLMRFKQLCNHPSQWLGDGGWAEADSGKLARLRELCEVIASRQDKVLVFTQFREVTAPLAGFLGGVFGRPGLVLHGSTAVGARKELVRRFQEDESIPFFVLSLKAGGTGLNLTAASHVIHFDRWWNPAVEDQATDRAFRIGQKRNVLVHKLVCRGTVEEKIDAMIGRKQKLSRELLAAGDEVDLTSLPDAELMRLVALDHRAAMGD